MKLSTIKFVQEEQFGESVQDPEHCVEFWHEKIETADWFSPIKETLIVLTLNARCKIIGHNIVSIGTVNETGAWARH